MMTGYTYNPTNDKDNEEDQMFVCTEIAAAESIEGLNYKPQKANQK